MTKKKTFVLLVIIAPVIFFIYCNKKIERTSDGKLFSDAATIPFNKTGLLLGTGKYLSDDTINLYYRYRIEAAKRLLQSGKIKYLIISGDNSKKEYNEPMMMRSDLIKAGIDSSVIYLDYAGFRTFDSMIRAKEVFGQDSLTVISQKFHNERAIYIASRERIYAVGFDAKDVDYSSGFKVQLREKFARVKVFLDYMSGANPKFLGPKVAIP